MILDCIKEAEVNQTGASLTSIAKVYYKKNDIDLKK